MFETRRQNEFTELVDLNNAHRANPTVATFEDPALADTVRDLLNAHVSRDPHRLRAVIEGCTRQEAKSLNHGAPLRNVIVQADARA